MGRDVIEAVDISRIRAFDLETEKVVDGLLAPEIVVGSMAKVEDGEVRGALLPNRWIARDALEQYLDEKFLIAVANGAFDMASMAQAFPKLLLKIFIAYFKGRIADVQIIQALDAIAGGHLGEDPRRGGTLVNPATGEQTTRYALATIIDLIFGRTDAKESAAFRTSYALLASFLAKYWPKDAVEYPVEDTKNTLLALLAQLRGWNRGKLDPETGPARNLRNLAAQAETAFALHLGAAHGFRTDPVRIAALSAEVEAQHLVAVERYQKFGWIRTGKHAWKSNGVGFTCRRCNLFTTVVGDMSRCKMDPDDGTEDTAAVKRSIAEAYGATGTCNRCGGSGRITPTKEKACRGEKVKGRYQGCMGNGCGVCAGTSVIEYPGDPITCLARDGGCDGTGFDLSTAPMLKRTDTGGIGTDRDVKMESGNDELSAFGEDEIEKVRSTYLPYVRRGIDKPLTLKPNILLFTGRVSYGDPIQQFPRKGKIRRCICARPGCYLCSTDYSAGECCTLAQVCLWIVGYSRMAQVINETKDPGSLHTMLAAQMMGCSFEEARALVKAGDQRAKDFRQAAKCGVFGLPGGMGSVTFVLAKRKSSEGFTLCPNGPARDHKGNAGYHGIRFCVLLAGEDACGKQKITEWKKNPCAPVCKRCVEVVESILKPAFFATYPEVRKYLDKVGGWVEKDGRVPCLAWNPIKKAVEVLRWRGGCTYTSGANNGFQALLSDIGKMAYRHIARECYLGRKVVFVGPERRPHVSDELVDYDGFWLSDEPSPLYGSRAPAFMHDEPLTEHPIQIAHLAAPRVGELMVQAGQTLAPDVYWKAEPALMEVWDKDAASVYDADGNLVVWRPKEKMAA